MKKTATIIAALAVAFSFSASAQILYKVEKEGTGKTSYVLGSHHFAPLSTVDSIEALPGIIEGAEKVYGELDMLNLNDPAQLMLMQQQMMAPADSTLTKLLTPEQTADLTAVWTKYVGSAEQLASMLPMVKPSVISTVMAAAMSSKALPDLNPNEGIDMTMQARAAEAGKPIAGLETMAFQTEMLYGRPIAEQLESLLKTVKEADDEGQKAIQLSEAYKAHDLNKLYELLIEADKDDPEAMERMIFSRNDTWVNTLKDEMEGTALFVVVGAGHLPGERGILEGLKKAGYTITAVD